MKIGWLVWYDEESKGAGEKPELWVTQPESWRCFIQIVYAEVIPNA